MKQLCNYALILISLLISSSSAWSQAQAQQTGTASLSSRENKSSSILQKSEAEEEDEGTLEAEIEHQRSGWYKSMQKKNVDYFKVKKQFDYYFKKHPDEDSKPRERYENWLKTQVFYLDKKNRVMAPPATNYNAVKKLAAVSWATVTDTMAGDWRMTGPRNTFQTNYSGVGNRGGYVSCVRIDPNNPQKLFVGFQQGGLWVSNDGGTVWQLTDKNLPDKSYADIDVCKANSNYVYAISKDAVIKSTDGGLTWISTSLNSTNNTGNGYDIAVSPTDPNIVVARWGTTLYRTADGGTTWVSVFVGLKANTAASPEVLDFHQANNNVVYHLEFSTSQTYVTLYRSGDAGVTFTNLGNINIPSGSLGTSVSCAKLLSASNNPNAVYIAMGTVNGTQNSIHLFKLDPTTGAVLLTRTNMLQMSLNSGDIAMDINSDNIIVHGTYSLSKTNYSTDNGATFTVSTTTVHADLRSLSIVDGKVLLGTDGEATYSSDGGVTYNSVTASISNHEIWGFGASHKTGVLGAGLNHGPLAIREHEGPGGWYNAMGADEQNGDVNPLDDKYLYSRGYDSYHVVRTGPHSMTSGGGQQQIDPGRYGYNTMHFHPNLYYTLITHHGGEFPKLNPNLAVWKNSLIRSDDNGVTVKIIKTFNAEIRREDICMTDPNRIYVVEGATNQKLWKTTDLGITWTDITPSTAVTGVSVRNISDVAVSDVNPNEIWVTYSGVQNTCQVIHSTDGGVTYSNLTTATLTTWPITKMLFQRGTNGGVYVGSRAGVFYRNNSMSDWQLIGNGLPMTDVRFMFINYFKGKLMIGTSRGVWDHDLYELTAPKAQISASTNKITTCGSSVNFADYSVLHKDAQTSYSWSFPGGSPSSSTQENPVVNYSVPGNYDVSLTVTDQYGSSTQTLPNFITVDCTAIIQTGSVTSVADAYVRDGGSATTNYGTENTLLVKNDGVGGAYIRETFLKFDLNSLPSTADKVSLQLNVVSAGTTSTNWQVYYVPTDSWTETGLIWNNKPDSPAPTLLATVPSQSSGTVTWDITSQVLSELGGDKILSLKIVSTTVGGSTVGTFSSREEANASLRPQIITSKINKVPTVSIASPTNNAVITAGSNLTINANAADADGTVSKVEFYQGGTLLGESTTAPYSFTWNNPAAGSYVLTAKVTDNNGTTSPSLGVNIVVNALPTIAISSPANNAVISAGQNLTINANASDSDGTVTKVEFYQGSTLLGTSTTTPYSFTWNNPVAGTYMLTAKATDNNGGVTTSDTVNVIVNALPTVAISSPANNAVISAGQNLTINANASDVDGTITKVEFYQGSTLLGTSTTTPYSFTWNNVAAGSYSITAVATDNEGSSITSGAVTVLVNAIVGPIADAYVRDGSYANTNYGTAITLAVKKDGTGYSREVYMKFDLNGINSFDNATLRLNIATAGINITTTTWQVYYVPTDSWSETGIIWNNKPVSGTLLATINGQSSGWAEWNISSQALAEFSGDKTLSLRITSTVSNSTADVSFRSKEDVNASLRPQLLLTSNSSIMSRNGLINKTLQSEELKQPEDKRLPVIYPNPVKDVLHINLNGNTGSAEAHVFDINGGILLNQKLFDSDTELNVSKLSSGLYLVKVFIDGEEIKVIKIVKM